MTDRMWDVLSASEPLTQLRTLSLPSHFFPFLNLEVPVFPFSPFCSVWVGQNGESADYKLSEMFLPGTVFAVLSLFFSMGHSPSFPLVMRRTQQDSILIEGFEADEGIHPATELLVFTNP